MSPVYKTVGGLTGTLPSDREIRFTRSFNAPAQMVFDAHTQPDLIKRWLLGPEGWTMPVCEVDLRVGGGYRYTWRKSADGSEFSLGGTYREIEAPHRIVHTERFEPDWTGGEAVCTFTLQDRDGVTDMTLTVLYPSQQIRDGALQTGMMDGMEASYERLDRMEGQIN